MSNEKWKTYVGEEPQVLLSWPREQHDFAIKDQDSILPTELLYVHHIFQRYSRLISLSVPLSWLGLANAMLSTVTS